MVGRTGDTSPVSPAVVTPMKPALAGAQVASYQTSSPKSSRKSFRSSLKSIQVSRKSQNSNES